MKLVPANKRENGLSMIFVLAALIVTGFIGGAMVKIVTGDQLSNAFYSTSSTARSAAQSGIVAAIQTFEDAGQATNNLDRLKSWIKFSNGTINTIPDNHRWLSGVAADDWYVQLSGTDLEYRTKIVAFDKERFNVTLMSEGIGKGKAKAIVTAVYHLDGLGYPTIMNWAEDNAMYIEDGVAIDLRGPIEINGGTRFSNSISFDNFASGSVFNGTFRTADAGATDNMLFRGQYTINGNAYFGKRPLVNLQNSPAMGPGSITINGRAGFPRGVKTDGGFTSSNSSSVSATGKSFWLGNFTTESWATGSTTFFEANGAVISHSGGAYAPTNTGVTKGSGGIVTVAGLVDNNAILDSLGMPRVPCQIEIHPDVIPVTVIKNLPNHAEINAEYLDTVTVPALWNGFKVLKVKAGEQVYGKNTAAYPETSAKVIILVYGELFPIGAGAAGRVFSVKVGFHANGKVDPATSGHVTIISVGSSADVDRWGGWNTFRGLLYRLDGSMSIGGALNSGVNGLYGALYARSGTSILWDPLPTDKGIVYYDKTVYEELDVNGVPDANGNTNFITKTGCSDAGTVDYTQLTVKKPISADLISQSM